MPSLQEISEAGALAAEQCVRESREIDYAYLTGNLHQWIDDKYAELMGTTNGSDSGTETNPGSE